MAAYVSQKELPVSGLNSMTPPNKKMVIDSIIICKFKKTFKNYIPQIFAFKCSLKNLT